MRITSECTIDLDEKRRIWVTTNADDVEPSQVMLVSTAVTEATVGQALAAHASVGVVEPAGAAIAARAKSEVPPHLRPKRPDDPDSMRAFGEDEEDED